MTRRYGLMRASFVGAAMIGATPVAAVPIVPDANTLVLDHFDGTTAGTGYGTITYGTSVSGQGQAAVFGAGDFIRYPWASLPQGTIEMWVNPDASSTGFSLLTMNVNNTTSMPGAGYYMHVGLTATNRFVSISTWPAGSATGATSIPLGAWTHIAMTWSSTSSQIYVNGVADGPASGGLSTGNGYFYLNYWGTTGFSGMIDELHISNIVRTPAEIAAHAVPEPAHLPSAVLAGLLGMAVAWRRALRTRTESAPDRGAGPGARQTAS